MCSVDEEFVPDSPLEEAVTSELVSEAILFVWAPEYGCWLTIQQVIQWLATQFPTYRNREFILA
jgi:hypothetical protein